MPCPGISIDCPSGFGGIRFPVCHVPKRLSTRRTFNETSAVIIRLILYPHHYDAQPATSPPSPHSAIAAIAQPPGVQKITSVEGITEYALPNGLHVLLFPDASKPNVTVNMTYAVETRLEGYGETGMAHLLEHMLFLQTTTRKDIKQELKDHGAEMNGSTSWDRTNYFETLMASEYAARALALGLAEIGFSDHSPMQRDDFDNWRMRLDQLDEYVEKVRRAQRDFPSLTIRLALEVDYLPGHQDWIRSLAARHPWDYLIGSVHYVSDSWAVDNPEEIAQLENSRPI